MITFQIQNRKIHICTPSRLSSWTAACHVWWLEASPAADFLSQCLNSTNHQLAVFSLILPPFHRLLATFFFYLFGFFIFCVVHPHLVFHSFILSVFLASFPCFFFSFSLTTRCVVSVPPHDVKRMAWNSTGNNSEQSQSSGPAAPLGGNATTAVNNIAKQSKNTARLSPRPATAPHDNPRRPDGPSVARR